MLLKLLTEDRSAIIARCRESVTRRFDKADPVDVASCLQAFMEHLASALTIEIVVRSRSATGTERAAEQVKAKPDDDSTAFDIHELLSHHCTIDQVVHAYGDVCQATIDHALDQHLPLTPGDFRLLYCALDHVIAEAVSEFSRRRDVMMALMAASATQEKLGILAHEMRNHIQTAVLALRILRSGKTITAASPDVVLDRCMVAMKDLVDRSLDEVKGGRVPTVHRARIPLSRFIDEISVSAHVDAAVLDCRLTVGPVDPSLMIEVDPSLLASAVSNLLQNAFKFTRSGTEVAISVRTVSDRILIQIEDHCGGIPHDAESWFTPFVQGSPGGARVGAGVGVGLGLAIARHNVEANQGTLTLSNIVGSGCMFTINLPRHAFM